MKYITIALALIASSRSILAQPARIVPDILDVVVDPESVVAPVPAPLLDAEEQHHKKAMASFIIASKLKSRQASRSQIIARHQAKQKREAPVLPEGPKCDGVLLAYFPTVSWKTPTQNKDLGRFFSEDGTPYAGSECARKCSRTPGCTYASVYDDMCELTSLTDVNLKEGGSYQSILQGSCEQNREDHDLSPSTACEQMCFVRKK